MVGRVAMRNRPRFGRHSRVNGVSMPAAKAELLQLPDRSDEAGTKTKANRYEKNDRVDLGKRDVEQLSKKAHLLSIRDRHPDSLARLQP
jgi:hypothetical protein